eukprot:scaffold173633_cov27-Tisochrysis_lutea.AAC.5
MVVPTGRPSGYQTCKRGGGRDGEPARGPARGANRRAGPSRAEGVTRLVVKPMEKRVPAVFSEVLCGAEVEPRVKFVDHIACAWRETRIAAASSVELY